MSNVQASAVEHVSENGRYSESTDPQYFVKYGSITYYRDDTRKLTQCVYKAMLDENARNAKQMTLGGVE